MDEGREAWKNNVEFFQKENPGGAHGLKFKIPEGHALRNIERGKSYLCTMAVAINFG